MKDDVPIQQCVSYRWIGYPEGEGMMDNLENMGLLVSGCCKDLIPVASEPMY